jgi:signal transduction histidine kinase
MEIKKANVSELHAFCSSLLENIDCGIIVLDPDGKISLINATARDLLGYSDVSPDEIKEKGMLKSLKHFPVLKNAISSALKMGGQSFGLEAEPLNRRYLDITGKSIMNGYLLSIIDVTPKKDLEVNAILSMISGQENERRRIAREIHDGFGPVLSSVKLELDSFLDEHHSIDADPSFEKLVNISDTLDSISTDLRNLSHHLSPRLLDEFGLFSALNSLTVRLNKSTKTNIEFYSNLNSGSRFAKDLELNLFRCGQELINNAVKYARANNILVQLILHKQSIVLMVEDDGIGFEIVETSQDFLGIGLTNVETRVRTLGGEFILDSVKNQGTTASVEVPI